MRGSEKEIPETAMHVRCSLEAAMRISVLGGEQSYEWPDRTEIRLSEFRKDLWRASSRARTRRFRHAGEGTKEAAKEKPKKKAAAEPKASKPKK